MRLLPARHCAGCGGHAARPMMCCWVTGPGRSDVWGGGKSPLWKVEPGSQSLELKQVQRGHFTFPKSHSHRGVEIWDSNTVLPHPTLPPALGEPSSKVWVRSVQCCLRMGLLWEGSWAGSPRGRWPRISGQCPRNLIYAHSSSCEAGPMLQGAVGGTEKEKRALCWGHR